MIKKQDSKTIIAKTFTATYDPYEDRIRFVINYQNISTRVDFMITRKFIINIIPSIDDFIERNYSTQESTNNQNPQTSSTNPLSQPQMPQQNQKATPTDNTDMKFLQTPDELLYKINISFNPKTKQSTLLFYSSNKQVKATLDSTTLSQVITMIKKAIPNFSWGISPNF